MRKNMATQTQRRGSLRSAVTTGIGKAVRRAAGMVGGGSAFPGMVVEKIDRGFLGRTLAQLPLGTVVVSGTNGKTSTTRMIAQTLENLGFAVATNPTGSNFVRGVVSSLVRQVDSRGGLRADVAVFELDEAYAALFVKQVPPRYCVLLNVLRDQLDRFGEIDNTARLLGAVAAATTGTVVLNRDDARVAALAGVARSAKKTDYYGLEPNLRPMFPSDDDLHGHVVEDTDEARAAEAAKQAYRNLPATVTLASADRDQAEFLIDGAKHRATMRVSGVYNLFNAAAALAVVRAVVADAMDARGLSPKAERAVKQLRAMAAEQRDETLVKAVSRVTPAFGRGETIDVDGTLVDLVLVKNPSGFRSALQSFSPEGADTMIAINDQYADGRDMSWLWDVDFTSLRGCGVAMVSGTRRWDMALRLRYDGVEPREVTEDLGQAVDRLLAAGPGAHKRIYCTYTAMLEIRKHLEILLKVDKRLAGIAGIQRTVERGAEER